MEWVQNLGFPLLRCDTVFVESLPPAITRRAVVFQGAERSQVVGLYMDVVEYGGEAGIVLFHLTRPLEELFRFVRWPRPISTPSSRRSPAPADRKSVA